MYFFKKVLLFVLLCFFGFEISFGEASLRGRYEGENKEYNEVMYFYGDNFIYFFSLGEYMAMVGGSYTLEKNVVNCIILKRNFSGWPEEKINILVLKKNDNNRLKFETHFGYDVSDQKFFKLTPDIKKKVIANKLLIRKIPNTNGEIISKIEKGKEVNVIATVKSDVIKNVEGNWVYVEFSKENFGYCFDGYLK